MNVPTSESAMVTLKETELTVVVIVTPSGSCVVMYRICPSVPVGSVIVAGLFVTPLSPTTTAATFVAIVEPLAGVEAVLCMTTMPPFIESTVACAAAVEESVE